MTGLGIAVLPMMVQSSQTLAPLLGGHFFLFMTKLTYPMYLLQYMIIQHMFYS